MFSDEVDRAALPGTVEDPRNRRLQALVVIGDRELDPGQPAGPQLAQELDPEALGLVLADIDPDHLAAA